MTKKDIAKAINSKVGFSIKESDRMVEFFFDQMKETLAAGEDVKLPKFGSFKVQRRMPRLARNPTTGEPVQLFSRLTVVFRPSKFLRAKINKDRKD